MGAMVLGFRWLLASLSIRHLSATCHDSVSHPRSSNRTCGATASYVVNHIRCFMLHTWLYGSPVLLKGYLCFHHIIRYRRNLQNLQKGHQIVICMPFGCTLNPRVLRGDCASLKRLERIVPSGLLPDPATRGPSLCQ